MSFTFLREMAICLSTASSLVLELMNNIYIVHVNSQRIFERREIINLNGFPVLISLALSNSYPWDCLSFFLKNKFLIKVSRLEQQSTFTFSIAILFYFVPY